MRPVRRADNLTTFMCWLSWNLGVSTSWNLQGLPRPVMGLLYLLFCWDTLSLPWKRYDPWSGVKCRQNTVATVGYLNNTRVSVKHSPWFVSPALTTLWWLHTAAMKAMVTVPQTDISVATRRSTSARSEERKLSANRQLSCLVNAGNFTFPVTPLFPPSAWARARRKTCTLLIVTSLRRKLTKWKIKLHKVTPRQAYVGVFPFYTVNVV